MIQELKRAWYRLCIMAGFEICERCGSFNVLQQGYPHNHRHYCQDCGELTWVYLIRKEES